MATDLSDYRCVGAMLAREGKASFDEGELVVRRGDNYTRVSSYLTDAVDGEQFTERGWHQLLADQQALELPPPLANKPLMPGSVAWLFRNNFEDRDSALAELRRSERALVAPIAKLPESDDAIAVVVVPRAARLRETWSERALSHATSHAATGGWEQVVRAAQQSFALAPELEAQRLGLLILAHERLGNPARAKGYLAAAEHSKGSLFRREVEEHQRVWSDRLLGPRLPAKTKSHAEGASDPWKAKRQQHLEAGKRVLSSEAA